MPDEEWDRIVAASIEADRDDRLHEVAGLTKEAFDALIPRPDDVNRKETNMADDATTQDEQESASTDDQHVPYERFKSANDRAKGLEAQLKELREQVETFENRDKSEVDRERTAREKAEQRAQELEGKVTNLERGGWVRSAAAKQAFIDSSDALANVDLSGIEDEPSARRAVERIAKQKPHLVKGEEKPPQVGRVLEGGQPVSSEDTDGKITPTEWTKRYGSAIYDQITAAKAHSVDTDDPLRDVAGKT